MSNVVSLKSSYDVMHRAYRKSVRDIAVEALQAMSTRITKAGLDDDLGRDIAVGTAAAIAMAVKEARLELITLYGEDDGPEDEMQVSQADWDLYTAAPTIEAQILKELRDKADEAGNLTRGIALLYASFFLDALAADNWVGPFVKAYAQHLARLCDAEVSA